MYIIYRVHVTILNKHPHNKSGVIYDRTFNFTKDIDADKFETYCIDAKYITQRLPAITTDTFESAQKLINRNLVKYQSDL